LLTGSYGYGAQNTIVVDPTLTLTETASELQVVNTWTESGSTVGYNFTINDSEHTIEELYSYYRNKWMWQTTGNVSEVYDHGFHDESRLNGTGNWGSYDYSTTWTIYRDSDTVKEFGMASDPSGSDKQIIWNITVYAGSPLIWVRRKVVNINSTANLVLATANYMISRITDGYWNNTNNWDGAFNPTSSYDASDRWALTNDTAIGGYHILEPYLNLSDDSGDVVSRWDFCGESDDHMTFSRYQSNAGSNTLAPNEYWEITNVIIIHDVQTDAEAVAGEWDNEIADSFASITSTAGATYGGRNNVTGSFDFTHSSGNNITFTFTPVDAESNFTCFNIITWNNASYSFQDNSVVLTEDTDFYAYYNSTNTNLDISMNITIGISIIKIYVNSAPAIGEFAVSDSTVYVNQPFVLNATINDVDERSDYINATVELTHSIILKWENATNAFSEYQDTNNYVTLNSGNRVNGANYTSYILQWNISINNMLSGSKNVVVTNTKVFDKAEASGSGSKTGVFTISQLVLVLQARDASGADLPRQVNLKGTMGNSTSFDVNSNTAGTYNLTTCYGSHTVNVWWGTHLIQIQTQSITDNVTMNIDTKMQRLYSASNYLLFSLNNTNLSTPSETAESGWRMLDITATGTIEFRMDNLNWKRTDEPSSFTIATTGYTPGTGTWSFVANIFTFDVPFSTQTLSMSWAAPPPPSGGGGGGGGGVPYVPPEEPVILPEEEAVTPTPIPTVLTPAPVMGIGAFLIIAVVVGAIVSGELGQKKSTPRTVWRKRKHSKPQRVKWSKKKTQPVKWPKQREKKRPVWKRAGIFD